MRRVATLLAATALVLTSLVGAPERALGASTYPMTFPVAGTHHYTDTFGACRGTDCSRTHEGNDIMADKMIPIVAVADGTVGWMHNERGVKCCAMALNHDDGWASWYIHMNNDTPGTDDGQGWGFAPGIAPGVHVVEGQLIGWVGDSGNAENVAPQLHFELHDPSGTPVDPYDALRAAQTGALARRSGTSRYGTAKAISEAGFPSGATEVFVAVGSDFADALTVGPVAGLASAPVLLSTSTALPTDTITEITRLSPDTITVIGGPGAIGDSVVAQLESLTGAPVGRLAGTDRYGTAAAISASRFNPGVGTVFVASGSSFPDGLAGSAAAGHIGSPVLLVGLDQIPPATATELQRLAPARIVVLGGTAVVSSAVENSLASYASTVDRIGGSDRYETAAAISAAFFEPGVPKVYIVTGANFPDAVAGVPLAIKNGAPLLLVKDDYVPLATLLELRRLNPTDIVILGGEAAISPWIATILLGVGR
ncbi:MAG: peptidoglycan DD-metalloendopeptidase family protein [Actinobacteria bacterium]|nr:peptidoglycan DD-metalloendopeptidase family protein [Actinomycetota bacterium]